MVSEIRHSVCALDCPDACALLVTVDESAAARNCAAIPIIRSRADSCAAKSRSIWSASITPTACSIRRGASAPRAKAASSASPGTKRSTRSPRDLPRASHRVRTRSDPALQLRRHHGLAQRPAWTAASSTAWARRGSTAPSARPPAWRGLTAGAGRPLRHRARAVPPLEADPRLGREHPRHQRPPVAVHRGSAAQRREVLRHRSDPHDRTAATADKHFAINPGSDLALALGHDARDHRRESARRDYVERYTDGL